jgi:secreted trypsin-like serine protease
MRWLFVLLLVLGGCVAAPTDRRAAIIGGVGDTGDPAVVMLVSYPPNQSTFFTCTASFIAPTVLVTAAHCVDAATHPGHQFGVFLGPDASAYTTAATLAPQLWPASTVAANPSYDPNSPFTADIGVVVLQSSPGVTPIPFARTALPPTLPGQNARLVGYGQTVYGTFNVIKHEAATTVQSLPPDDTVVVGDSTHHSCVGDSGGPALVMLGGVETIIGVDSYTATTGCVDPAFYRRVDQYTTFLDSYIPIVPADDFGPPPDFGMPRDMAAPAVDFGTAAPPSGCAVAGRPASSWPLLLLALIVVRLARGFHRHHGRRRRNTPVAAVASQSS